jgi:hypothetical protein
MKIGTTASDTPCTSASWMSSQRMPLRRPMIAAMPAASSSEIWLAP